LAVDAGKFHGIIILVGAQIPHQTSTYGSDTMKADPILIIEPESLRVRQGGAAVAKIWLVANNHEFPARGWYDIIVVVLGWWSAGLLKILKRISTTEVLYFMDGPYSVEISQSASGVIQFRMIDRSSGDGGRLINECEGAMEPFTTYLISQSRKVLAGCKMQNRWSADADALASSLDELEQEAFLLNPGQRLQ
jgi:hypothetical protein